MAGSTETTAANGTYAWVAEAFFGPHAEAASEQGGGTGNPVKDSLPRQFVAFDLETTGLDPKKERIVEVGGIRFDRKGIVVHFSALVNPGKPMPEEASRINGISDEMLTGKPSIAEVMPDFLRFIADSAIIAHNAPFDCSFINAELERLAAFAKKWDAAAGQGDLLAPTPGEGSPGDIGAPEEVVKPWKPPFSTLPNQVIDTRIYAKEAFPGRWKYSLQELAKDLQLDALDAHRAEDDARVCMDLFIKCAEKSAGRTLERSSGTVK